MGDSSARLRKVQDEPGICVISENKDSEGPDTETSLQWHSLVSLYNLSTRIIKEGLAF